MLALADPDLDNGPRTDKSATMRMCAVSREVRPIDELIRFVVAPSGEVIPDLKRKLPGRGLWVRPRAGPLRKRCGVTNLAEGSSATFASLRPFPPIPRPCWNEAATEALAMAAKAGQVISGFAKVEGLLEQGRAGALIHASDGAADGIRKLDAIAGQRSRKYR